MLDLMNKNDRQMEASMEHHLQYILYPCVMYLQLFCSVVMLPLVYNTP